MSVSNIIAEMAKMGVRIEDGFLIFKVDCPFCDLGSAMGITGIRKMVQEAKSIGFTGLVVEAPWEYIPFDPKPSDSGRERWETGKSGDACMQVPIIEGIIWKNTSPK